MEQLKNAMKKTLDGKMTQVELAKKSGVSQGRISKILNGKTTQVKLSTMEKLLPYLLPNLQQDDAGNET